MDKKQAKRRTKKPVVIVETYQAINSDRVYVSGDKVSTDKLVDIDMHKANPFAGVHPDLLALAYTHAGDNPTEAELRGALDRLLR